MDGTMVGLTPLGNQYSGRHISSWKSLVVPVDRLAPGVTGKIQVGEDPGASAQVSVPAWAVPVAAGTEPKAPVEPETEPAELLLAQAGQDQRPRRRRTRPASWPGASRSSARVAVVPPAGWLADRAPA